MEDRLGDSEIDWVLDMSSERDIYAGHSDDDCEFTGSEFSDIVDDKDTDPDFVADLKPNNVFLLI